MFLALLEDSLDHFLVHLFLVPLQGQALKLHLPTKSFNLTSLVLLFCLLALSWGTRDDYVSDFAIFGHSGLIIIIIVISISTVFLAVIIAQILLSQLVMSCLRQSLSIQKASPFGCIPDN